MVTATKIAAAAAKQVVIILKEVVITITSILTFQEHSYRSHQPKPYLNISITGEFNYLSFSQKLQKANQINHKKHQSRSKTNHNSSKTPKHIEISRYRETQRINSSKSHTNPTNNNKNIFTQTKRTNYRTTMRSSR